MWRRIGPWLTGLVIVLGCVMLTSTSAALALRRPPPERLDADLGSRLAADYSPDSRDIHLAPLDYEVIQAAASDEAALLSTPSAGTPATIEIARVPTATPRGAVATPTSTSTSTAITLRSTGTPASTATSMDTPAVPTATVRRVFVEPSSTPTPPPPNTAPSTFTPTNTRIPPNTPTNTRAPTHTPTRLPATATPAETQGETATPTQAASRTPTRTPTGTPITETATPSGTPTITFTPTPTGSATPTPSTTATITPTLTPSPTITGTPPTETPTVTPRPTDTPTVTPRPTDTPLRTATATDTVTPVRTPTDTPTQVPTAIPTLPVVPTNTPTGTLTPMPTLPATATATHTPTITPTPTRTPTITPTPTPTPTLVKSGLYINPVSQTVPPGQVSAEIMATGVEDLGSYTITVNWDDDSVLQFVSIDNGPLLGSSGLSVICTPPIVDSNSATLSCDTLGLLPGASGDGVLATIDFTAVAEGKSAVTLDPVKLASTTSIEMSVTTTDGSITVELPTPTPTDTPTDTPPPNTPTPPPLVATLFCTAQAPVTSNSGDNDGFELNPANACGDDGIFAQDIATGTNNTGNCSDAGKDRHDFTAFDIGSMVAGGGTITVDGIELRLDVMGSANAYLCAELSWDDGSSWTAAKFTFGLSGSETTYWLGSPTDTWGHTWQSSDGSGFRVRLTSVANIPNANVLLDAVEVRVYYTP